MLVGSLQKNSYTGAAYVFTRSGADWTQQTEFVASDTQAGDEFGCSIAQMVIWQWWELVTRILPKVRCTYLWIPPANGYCKQSSLLRIPMLEMGSVFQFASAGTQWL